MRKYRRTAALFGRGFLSGVMVGGFGWLMGFYAGHRAAWHANR